MGPADEYHHFGKYTGSLVFRLGALAVKMGSEISPKYRHPPTRLNSVVTKKSAISQT
jgi:hypothetical protein